MTGAAIATAALVFSAIAQTVFRVPVRAVDVPVAVKDPAGRFVHDVAASQLRVYDNGHPQNFQLDVIDEPVALAIVVQTNDVVRAWLPQITRVPSLIESAVLGERGKATVISFADTISIIRGWTSDALEIDSAIRSLKPSIADQSRCLNGVLLAAQELQRVPAPFRRVILLLSQPFDHGSRVDLKDVLGSLETNNIVVYHLAMPRVGKDLAARTISIGSPDGVFGPKDTGIMGTIDLATLVPAIFRDSRARNPETQAEQNAIAIMTAETGGSRFSFRRLRDLEAAIGSIATELHTEYVVNYTVQPADPGYHRIRIEVGGRDLRIRAKPGYCIPE